MKVLVFFFNFVMKKVYMLEKNLKYRQLYRPPVLKEEALGAIKCMKGGKATGPDKIYVEELERRDEFLPPPP